jgi:hypothetical protein
MMAETNKCSILELELSYRVRVVLLLGTKKGVFLAESNQDRQGGAPGR